MAIFEEKRIRPWVVVLILLAVFVIAYPAWHLGERELFWNEGDVAGIISEMTSFPPAVTLHGKLSGEQYPLFPLVCKIFRSVTGASMEFTLRFVSVLCLGILSFLVGYNCYRSDGIQAGAAA